MDPFHMLLALGPVSMYLLIVSGLNAGRHPWAISGARDVLALTLATTGLALAGPLALFTSPASLLWMGPYVWIPLTALYLLSGCFVALVMRPRLIVYNISSPQCAKILSEILPNLDAEHQVVGQFYRLPKLGIQFTLETSPPMTNVQLRAVGGEQDLDGWHQLGQRLRDALREVRVPANPRARSFLVFAVLIWALVIFSIVQRPTELAAGLERFLRP